MGSSAKVVKKGDVTVLLVANASGSLCNLNALAYEHGASAIVHTGLFGFFDHESTQHLSDKQLLRIVERYSRVNRTLVADTSSSNLKEFIKSHQSELELFVSGAAQFSVPVYTVYGSDDDPAVVEKFRNGEYKAENLFLLDETAAPLIPDSNVRVYGLGGTFDLANLLNASNHSFATDAERNYVGLWQIGELVHLLGNTYDESEFKVFVYEKPDNTELLHFIDLLKLMFPMDAMLCANDSTLCALTDSYANLTKHEQLTKHLQLFSEQMTPWWDNVKADVFGATESQPNMRALLQSTGQLLSSPPKTLENVRIPATCLRSLIELSGTLQSTVVFTVTGGSKAEIETKSQIPFDAVKKEKFTREAKLARAQRLEQRGEKGGYKSEKFEKQSSKDDDRFAEKYNDATKKEKFARDSKPFGKKGAQKFERGDRPGFESDKSETGYSEKSSDVENDSNRELSPEVSRPNLDPEASGSNTDLTLESRDRKKSKSRKLKKRKDQAWSDKGSQDRESVNGESRNSSENPNWNYQAKESNPNPNPNSDNNASNPSPDSAESTDANAKANTKANANANATNSANASTNASTNANANANNANNANTTNNNNNNTTTTTTESNPIATRSSSSSSISNKADSLEPRSGDETHEFYDKKSRKLRNKKTGPFDDSDRRDKFENKFVNSKFENKFDNSKFDNKFENKFESKFDKRPREKTKFRSASPSAQQQQPESDRTGLTDQSSQAPAPRVALWFKNGNHSAKEILGFLNPKDRALNPTVKFSEKKKTDGTSYKSAFVQFANEEQAQKSYSRVNKESAGSVSLVSSGYKKK